MILIFENNPYSQPFKCSSCVAFKVHSISCECLLARLKIAICLAKRLARNGISLWRALSRDVILREYLHLVSFTSFIETRFSDSIGISKDQAFLCVITMGRRRKLHDRFLLITIFGQFILYGCFVRHFWTRLVILLIYIWDHCAYTRFSLVMFGRCSRFAELYLFKTKKHLYWVRTGR